MFELNFRRAIGIGIGTNGLKAFLLSVFRENKTFTTGKDIFRIARISKIKNLHSESKTRVTEV